MAAAPGGAIRGRGDFQRQTLRPGERIVSYSTKRKIFVFMLIAAMFCYFSADDYSAKAFLQIRNISTLFQEVSIWGIAAIGVTFVMIAGGMDLSTGAIIAFSTMLIVNCLYKFDLPVAVLVPSVLGAGALIGYVNSVIITRLNLIDFIVTLSTKGLISGCALVVAIKQSGMVQNIYIDNKEFLGIFAARLDGRYLHAVIPVFFILAFIAHIVLSRTRWGTYVYAVGSNANSAVLSGISLRKVKAMVYIFSGVCCSVTAMFLSARMRTAMPDMGLDMEMDIVAAVIIGGTAFKGGSGDIIGTVTGMFFLQLLKNGIFKFHVAPAWQPIIIGGVIMVTVIFDETYKRVAARIQEQKYDAEASGRFNNTNTRTAGGQQ